MILIEFPAGDFIYIFPAVFGLFGFIKKAFKKVKNIAGGALSFVPGGSIIKQGIRTAKFGIGAIIREVKGRPKSAPQQTQFGPPPQFGTPPQGSAFASFGQMNEIFGINRNLVFGLLAAGVLFFVLMKRK